MVRQAERRGGGGMAWWGAGRTGLGWAGLGWAGLVCDV